MNTSVYSPAIRQALASASQALQSGNLVLAEMALAPFFSGMQPANPDLLNIAGTLRMNQGRLADAVGLFEAAVKAVPREPIFAFNLGMTLSRLGRDAEAQEALWKALKFKPDFEPALFELGALQHRAGKLDAAEKNIRHVLRVNRNNAHAELALGAILTDARRPDEAEAAIRRGLALNGNATLKAQLQMQLAQALRHQRKDDEALAALDAAQALCPTLQGLARHRADTLQNLNRFDEAIAIFKSELARTPTDPGLHLDYNSLLYQLDRKSEFLKSFDQAPPSRDLLLGKAFLQAREKRLDEAYAIYADLQKRDPGDRLAAIGAAQLLTRMGRYDEAIAAFEHLIGQGADDPKFFSIAAEPALLHGDPQKAAWICEQGLAKDPINGSCLAMTSVASRMLGDERDDAINGYDTLVRSFDLEPPSGFASMDDFNFELNEALNRLHPKSREFIDQSLRGGTQTPGNLFPAKLPLVSLLKERIDEAVARYIAELKQDDDHPLLSRRSRGFRYSGSWSSRLHDSGYHFNHIHPDGWISSCYYIALPNVVQDETQQQGWIKFGEPALDLALHKPVRRTVQPVPGRLVLFPSYMWHGTVPFRDAQARTTIAFDVVPTE